MKRGIIIAGFGTAYEETRRLCIESIENKVKEKYKDYQILRAFTSKMVIDKLKRRDNIYVLNETEAVQELKERGIENISIQSLHIIPGHEYEKLTKFDVRVGAPLLNSEEDCIKIVKDIELNNMGNNDALVFMGHGSNHEADKAYEILENIYHKKGFDNIFIGTVEGSKTIEEIVTTLNAKNIKKVRLKPFMLVAGDHAINDLASDDEDSWKSILESRGFEVEICLKGLGEYNIIKEIFLEHLEEILE